jgi:hypothetical protein
MCSAPEDGHLQRIAHRVVTKYPPPVPKPPRQRIAPGMVAEPYGAPTAELRDTWKHGAAGTKDAGKRL